MRISSLARRALRRALRSLLATSFALAILVSRPVRARAPCEAEAHTLLCHRHVVPYLYTAKTLFRYTDRVGLVVHDDGTLTRLDRAVLAWHLRGVRVLTAAEAARTVEPQLARYPRLRALRAEKLGIRLMVDCALLASTDRVLRMDSDILFLDRPSELLDWIEGRRNDTFLYSPEAAPRGPDWVPEHFPGAPFFRDLCCGFVCFDRRAFPWEAVEEVVAKAPAEVLARKQWVPQMLYALLGTSFPEPRGSLGPRYESGRITKMAPRADRVIYHYFGSLRIRDSRDLFAQEGRMFLRAWPARGPRICLGLHRVAARHARRLSEAP